MNTPIYDFLQKYADSNTLRLHMPGHKGSVNCSPLSFINPYDITEINGADSLFEDDGIIKESELNAQKLFNTKCTLYSVGGSTLCIQTMLALVSKPKSTVIAPRNVHKAFINTCILLDLNISFVYPKTQTHSIVSYEYTLEDIEDAIKNAENPCCVYITSPDYYGRVADIKSISSLAHKYNLPLLVDNAHGAHLAFLEESIHPIALGADMCCDSAHKMLPVLTGGAYLHINNEKCIEKAKDTMAMFASTSPSYLIMCSLDLCNDYLENSIKDDLKDVLIGLKRLRERLDGMWAVAETEPLHLTLLTYKNGVNGNDLADYLRKEKNIECEYSDDNSVVFLFSPLNSREDMVKLFDALTHVIRPKLRIEPELIEVLKPQRKMTLREAALSETEYIDTENALNRICGLTRVTCPPGIAIVCGGEVIDEKSIHLLKRYNINKINVVKE